MSGFEIAGLVLGAFPIALEALKQYEVIKRQVKLWRRIQEEYVDCQDELSFQQLLFEDNIQDLLSTLGVDEQRIKDFILSRGQDSFQDGLLENLLDPAYNEPYLRCVRAMERTMRALNHELGTESEYVQQKLGSSPRASKLANIRYQLWRAHFSTGEASRERRRLLAQLRDQNETLEKLLKMNNKKKEQQGAKKPAADLALCSFWDIANTLFKALAGASKCTCGQGCHTAKLLLQHRAKNESEFNVLFVKALPSKWEIRRTRISQQPTCASPCPQQYPALDRVVTHQPEHRANTPTNSSMKKQTASVLVERSLSFLVTPTTFTPQSDPPAKAISHLCSSLDSNTDGCYGYLDDDEYRYYVYKVYQNNTGSFHSLSLNQILQGCNKYGFSRKRRYYLAFTLASSFLQFLETPWLHTPWTKSDIVFINESNDSTKFLLDQPYLDRDPIAREGTATKTQGDPVSPLHPLDVLGIMLLELCFGKSLEDRLDTVGTDSNIGHKLLAALEWQTEVNDETGSDYSNAVAWCLKDRRMIPLDKWRQAMLQNVVKPLEKLYQDLFDQ